MLKKIMIICLVLSFILIGGNAFAGKAYGPNSGHDTTGEGAPNSGDGIPDGSGW